MSSQQVNIASHLPVMASAHPYKPAVIFPESRDPSGRVAYTHMTFRQLDDESNRLASGLEGIGLGRGIRTVLMVKPSLDFFALTFALFKIGAVPVLIDPGMGLKNLKTCLSEAEPAAFIGIPKAQAARVLLRWPRVEINITVGPRLFWGGFSLDEIRAKGSTSYTMAETDSEETAAILFTSGSTGVPKGAVYSHGIFDGQVRLLKEIYGIRPGETDLATFPLFALFGPALGMAAVIPDMDATRPAHVDPTKIVESIHNFGITQMFGSPALLNRVGRYGQETKIELPSLRRVISAGAPVQTAVLERFSGMLGPGAEIHTPYGATEALPICTIGSKEILEETASLTHLGKGVCVGRPVPGILLEIVGITDEPIESWSGDLAVPDGTIGEITVTGPVVTKTYYNRDASTHLAKIHDTENGRIWHRMGDVGYRDETGRIWFCGRKTHRVLTGEGVLFTIPCEGVFNAHPAVYRTALVGLPENGSRQRPVLCVELEKSAEKPNRDRIKTELLEMGSAQMHTRSIRTILFHNGFPVDIRHNAKIFREKLAVWAKNRVRGT